MSSVATRHERRRQETRERILEAAADLFGEQGVQTTKVAEICEAADVAHQTFFNHFPTKADLVAELVAAGRDFVAATVDGARRDGGTTAERLALLFARIPEATTGVGPRHHDLLAETVRVAQTGADPERERRIHDAIGALVQEGIEAGEVTRRHDPADLELLVFATLHMLMLEWASQPDYPIAERAERVARLLTDALASDGP